MKYILSLYFNRLVGYCYYIIFYFIVCICNIDFRAKSVKIEIFNVDLLS